MSDVEKHNTEEDCWVTIGSVDKGGPFVYDVTKYLDEVREGQPGGRERYTTRVVERVLLTHVMLT